MFKPSNKQKMFVSPANTSLVGMFITIGDVADIFAIDDTWAAVYVVIRC